MTPVGNHWTHRDWDIRGMRRGAEGNDGGGELGPWKGREEQQCLFGVL